MLEQGHFADMVKLIQFLNARVQGIYDDKVEIIEEGKPVDKTSKKTRPTPTRDQRLNITLSSATANLAQLFRDKGMKFQKDGKPDKSLKIVDFEAADKATATEYLNVLSNLGFRDVQI